MRKGTTPTHIFKLPFNTDTLKSVMVIYAQNNVEVFKKETADCVLEGDTVSVTLTQEETFKFNHDENVQIQMRVLTAGGNALASNIQKVAVRQCLNCEVLA